MYTFTVFTATHNRAKLLLRVYQSLLNQTYKDFIWLVVDDESSTDNTADVMQELKERNEIPIKYVKKPGRGKHTALRLGFEMAPELSKYIVDIDDDDELLPECLQTFYDEWCKIEKEGRNDISSVRALTQDERGNILADLDRKYLGTTLDGGYADINLLLTTKMENVSCFKAGYFNCDEIFDDSGKWLADKANSITEAIYWLRMGRVSINRYIFKPLRMYHYDAPESLTRIKVNFSRIWYDKLFAAVIFENEFHDEVVKSRYFYFKRLVILNLYSNALGISLKELNTHLERKQCRTIMTMTRPLFRLIGLWYNKQHQA